MNNAGSVSSIIIFILILLGGCSPEAGKKALNFFFDGVPGDELLEQTTSIDSIKKPDTTVQETELPNIEMTVYHIPYLEKDCSNCHDQNTMGRYILPQPKLCYQCHENFEERYKTVHGPVAGGYCTACHQPHYAQENLLKRSGQELCLNCHVPGESFNTTIHEGIEDTNCIECHNPHGGEDRLMFN